MKMTLSLLLVLMSLSVVSAQAPQNKSCSVVDCPTGTKAVANGAKNDPYFACGTSELVEYTTLVAGMASMTYSMTGKLPNISDKTGEPEYTGETKAMLDKARAKAGVATFDQAIAKCKKGIARIKVTVMNNPKDSMAIWVMNDSQKSTFWMPKAYLYRR